MPFAIRMKEKKILEVTPIFWFLTLIMFFAFTYSFTLELQAPTFYESLKIFRWLYIIGLLVLFRSAIVRDDLELTLAEFGTIFYYMMIGVVGIAFVNFGITLLAVGIGALSIENMIINYGVFADLGVAALAGYNEEIAFAALYYLIDRFLPNNIVGLKLWIFRTSFNTATIIALLAIAVLFPIYHVVAYAVWGIPFLVLYLGRIVLSIVFIKSKRIEAAILSHWCWDVVVVLPKLFAIG